jgi:hypothetical protein
VTRLAKVGCTEAEIATLTGHSLRDVRSILDQHYLARDPALAESAIRKLERGTDLPKRPLPFSNKRGKSSVISIGWGTWIRTKIDGVRVRCSTVELSPNASTFVGHSPCGRGRGAGMTLRRLSTQIRGALQGLAGNEGAAYREWPGGPRLR